MNKNRFFRSATAAVCAVLCLALLLCITSCFNLSSTQRGNFSFTISEDVVQQIDNALGPRSARNSGVPVITATVTLEKTAGGQLVEPVAKSGILATLINETFTFEDLPLHVPFTVSVSFKADGKELFSGTSEPITLTSEDTTQVAIALKHILDTDIVLPYWEYDAREDEYTPIGSFIFGENDTLEVPDPDDTSRLSGPVTSCFDAYGNIWSIDTMYSPVSYGVGNGLYFKGKEAYSFEDETDILTSGYVRSFIPYGYWITCDYATNELYICYWDSEAETYPVIKFSVDALLSLDPAKEMMLPSCMKEETELITDLKEIGYELSYVEPLITENDTVYDIIYDSIVFAVNNGILYSIGGDEDLYLASIDLKTKTILQEKPFDLSSILGPSTDSESVSINDILYQDGKLYVLASFTYSKEGASLYVYDENSFKPTPGYYGTGAVVRIDPATLSFGRSDVLGTCTEPESVTTDCEMNSGVWVMNDSDGNPCELGKITYNEIYDSYDAESLQNTRSLYYYPKAENFTAPLKFVAIKPKKLVIADCGFTYTDDIVPVNKLMTIDLTSFSIEEHKEVPFNMSEQIPDNQISPCLSPDFSFSDVAYYNAAGYGSTERWEDISFTEEEFATLLNNGDIFYYIYN